MGIEGGAVQHRAAQVGGRRRTVGEDMDSLQLLMCSKNVGHLRQCIAAGVQHMNRDTGRNAGDQCLVIGDVIDDEGDLAGGVMDWFPVIFMSCLAVLRETTVCGQLG